MGSGEHKGKMNQKGRNWLLEAGPLETKLELFRNIAKRAKLLSLFIKIIG
jgi:hypothetical protein